METPNHMRIQCPHCSKRLRVGMKMADRRVLCPNQHCRQPIDTPSSFPSDSIGPQSSSLAAKGPQKKSPPTEGGELLSLQPKPRRMTVWYLGMGITLGCVAVSIILMLLIPGRDRNTPPDADANSQATTGEQKGDIILTVPKLLETNRKVSPPLAPATQPPGEVRRMEVASTLPKFAVAFSPDGRQLLVGGIGLRLYDAATGHEIRHFKLEGSGPDIDVWSVAFSSDGKMVASGDWDKFVRVWDLETGKELDRHLRHTRVVTSVVFARDGNQVISGSWDGSVQRWDLVSGQVRLLGEH